ncbi:MAG: phosphate ABC transporter permease subunit PstC [Bacteroidota bacterium]
MNEDITKSNKSAEDKDIKFTTNSEFFADTEDNQGKRPEKEKPINPYLIHSPLKYGKKFYISEFLAERFIQIVAFTSIAFILAIFYYVFQEASYAFRGEKPKVVQNSVQKKAETLVQESYGSDNVPDKQEKPELLQQEVYGAEPSNPATSDTNTVASSSLEKGRDKSTELQTTGQEKSATIAELLFANDTIQGKASYIWQPIGERPKYSFIPLFFGAFKVTVIGLLIAAPIAILAAIFTTAFAPRWLREIMKPSIEILAGFPSVVIGFFCLITLATIVQQLFGTTFRLNSFVGGLGMAIAVIPIIYTVTEDALASVPKYMKEASLALGGSKWQTAYRVVLPAATPGVFAAIILGFGRAFGETMIVLMATGNAALVSGDIFESVRTMAATIGAEMAEVEFHSVHYGVLFLIGALLFVVTFSLNAIAEFWVRKRLLKRFQGK